MRKNILLIFSFIVTTWFLCACSGSKSNDKNEVEAIDSVMTIKHAKGFEVTYHKDYKRVVIKNTFSEQGNLHVYYLVDNQQTPTPTDGEKVTIPLKSIGITSCTHIGELDRLSLLEKISCLCNPEYIYNQQMKERVEGGLVKNIGDALNINIECLLAAKPSMLMMTIYNLQDENIKRITEAGIPVLFNNEWMEEDPLGRAEWIKMIATFFNEENNASLIFDQIEKNYDEIKETVNIVGHKPTVMIGNNFKGTWYMSGGQCYMAQLIKDAGGDYQFANDTSSGSLPLSFEMVLKNFKHTDCWVNAPVTSIKELIEMDERHNLFNPVAIGEVYAFLGKTLPNSMANDCWESGVVNPDIMLKDFVWAFHPEIVPNHTPYYIIKLKQ
ncbi:MAG: ABC transporter substrate-binding protein [Bacteroidales bacterium]|nr:ABC transporter substrate-binding protein [Bacteroidales bacterium]